MSTYQSLLKQFPDKMHKQELTALVHAIMHEQSKEAKDKISDIISDSLDFAFENGWMQGKDAYKP